MAQLRTAHTADLDGVTRAAVGTLLDGAFHGDFSDHDWDETLGGMHVLMGNGVVHKRRLLHHGRALRTGYLEGVAGGVGTYGPDGHPLRRPRLAAHSLDDQKEPI